MLTMYIVLIVYIVIPIIQGSSIKARLIYNESCLLPRSEGDGENSAQQRAITLPQRQQFLWGEKKLIFRELHPWKCICRSSGPK